MAVYYATTQQRMLGRLLQAKQVKLWIRGGSRAVDTARLVPSLNVIVQRFRNRFARQSLANEQSRAEWQPRLEALLRRMEEARPQGRRNPNPEEFRIEFYGICVQISPFWWYKIFEIPFEFLPSDPEDFSPNRRDRKNLKRAIIN